MYLLGYLTQNKPFLIEIKNSFEDYIMLTFQIYRFGSISIRQKSHAYLYNIYTSY